MSKDLCSQVDWLCIVRGALVQQQGAVRLAATRAEARCRDVTALLRRQINQLKADKEKLLAEIACLQGILDGLGHRGEYPS